MVPPIDVALYERNGEPLTAQCIPLAFEMVGGISSGTHVLDVACGPGGLSVAAAGLGARVVATDFAAPMVERAGQRLAPFPGCSATVMDAQALDFDDDTFDVAFSMFGVINLPDWRAGLRELTRVTRVGGRGCISSWEDPRTVAAVAVLVDAMAEVFPDREPIPVPEGVMLAAKPDVLQECMTVAGFRDVTVAPVQIVWDGPAVSQFLDELDETFGFMPPYLALTAEERELLTPALLAAAQRRAGTDGRLRIDATAHLAAGTV
ncbi:MAG: class I SAM-dependent methyltransferase [Mycobacterium kyogaense]|uniref:class I SAM-dependent methyltransferase n=1 Tax=Mycobacterium kyogaense TaxID=2212479 RepID=UPI002FF78E96